jgi:hypothetical protein
MKKIFLIIVILVVFWGQANAQRYLTGEKGIQASVGAVNGINPEQTFYFGVGIATYTKKCSHWVFGGEYLQEKLDYKLVQIPISQFTAEGGYYYGFLSDPRKNVLLSIGVSGLAGYETLNWGNKLLYDGASLMNQDAFLYGGALTLELETYITNRIVLLVNARERILCGSPTVNFTTQLGSKIALSSIISNK